MALTLVVTNFDKETWVYTFAPNFLLPNEARPCLSVLMEVTIHVEKIILAPRLRCNNNKA